MAVRPEILAPAGNVEKLKTAFHFGADAVYVGLKRFSLRNFATNFEMDELEWSLGHARERGGRVYVALNMLPYDADLVAMEADVRTLAKLGPDGLIVSDPGVLDLVQREAPLVPVHLSTQANVMNTGAARFWLRQGVERIIVARELSLVQLKELATAAPGQIEVFVHGAVCISYSGRCFLSLYWADRDALRGECAQACRWKHRELEEEKRPGERHYLREDDRYTYFFDARDLCALPVLEKLYAAGVASWKIEGRMKSEHYVAVTADVYRQAAEWLAAGDVDGLRASLNDLVTEVSRVSNRSFSTHFLEGEVPDRATYNAEGSQYHNYDAFLGKVVGRADHHIDVSLRNPLRPGDNVELCDRGLVREVLTVNEVREIDGTLLDFGRTGVTVRLSGNFPVETGAILRRGLAFSNNLTRLAPD
jgi:U32 family peptidase